MSITSVPTKARYLLYTKAAGRCQYDGCNTPLWRDPLTKHEFNSAYIAHIIADKAAGPRGHSVLSKQLRAAVSNLMLLCDRHHRLVDIEDVAGHTVELLTQMKNDHERRIEIACSITAEKQSHVVLYGANIGDHSSPVSYDKAAVAMSPERFPANSDPIALGMYNSSFVDRDLEFWRIESSHLRRMIDTRLRQGLADRSIAHSSIFALAPQPLLMLLGYLLSDIPAAEVYQYHREPQGWTWQQTPDSFDFVIEEPIQISGPPALVFSLSATVTNERILAVEPQAAIWRLAIPQPNNDCLKSRAQAAQFRSEVRKLMDRIKARHGEMETLRVFPAMPAALAVEFGRIVMPKADLPVQIYDENRTRGGFVHALDLGKV